MSSCQTNCLTCPHLSREFAQAAGVNLRPEHVRGAADRKVHAAPKADPDAGDPRCPALAPLPARASQPGQPGLYCLPLSSSHAPARPARFPGSAFDHSESTLATSDAFPTRRSSALPGSSGTRQSATTAIGTGTNGQPLCGPCEVVVRGQRQPRRCRAAPRWRSGQGWE